MKKSQDVAKLAEAALAMIDDGFVVGLGSGRAASRFVETLGLRVQAGLRIRGVPTSSATATLADRVGVPLATLDEIDTIDIAVDGADEVDPQLNLIKGLGGALVREKIIATAARRLVILVGDEKIVPVLGAHGVLPVEVTPFARTWCARRLAQLGYPPEPRRQGADLFVTDNGNHILDCKVPPLSDPAALEQTLRSMPGIVGTGLFLGIAHTVLIQTGDSVQVQQRG